MACPPSRTQIPSPPIPPLRLRAQQACLVQELGGKQINPHPQFTETQDMVRRRINVVESNEEYMMEEPIEHHNSAEKDVESSDVHEDCDNANSDENEDAENAETNERKKRKLKYIWNLPKGKTIMVRCNDIDQPIGKETKHLGDFLGSVAWNGSLCCLSYKDWRLLKTKTNVKAILDQVKMRFLYPPRMEKYILKTIGDRWRQHKSDQKAIYFDMKRNTEANYNNKPKWVTHLVDGLRLFKN